MSKKSEDERLKAIMDEIESGEKGYGSSRKWYISTKLLDSLGMEQYTSSEGTNFLRIIPPPNRGVYFGLKIFVHYNIGPDDDAFLCPKMMREVFGDDFFVAPIPKRCPICERQQKLKNAGADSDLVKALGCFPPRYIFFVVDMSSRKSEDKGVVLYDAPKTVNDAIVSFSKNKRTGEITNITDPDDGKSIVFERTGTKAFNTKYSGFELEHCDPIPDEWLDQVPDFKNVLTFASAKEIEESLYVVSEDDEDEEERRPRKQDRDDSRRSRKRNEEEDEDDDDRRPRGRDRDRNEEDDDRAPRRRNRDEDKEDKDGKQDERRNRRSREKDQENDIEEGELVEDEKSESSEKDSRLDNIRARVKEKMRRD